MTLRKMTDVTMTLATPPQPVAAASATTAHLWIRAFHNGRNKSIRIDNPTTVSLATIRHQLETAFQAPASTPRKFRYLEYLGDDERVALRTKDDWLAAIQLVKELERAHLHVFCVDREEAEAEPDDDHVVEQARVEEKEIVEPAVQEDAALVPLPSSPPQAELSESQLLQPVEPMEELSTAPAPRDSQTFLDANDDTSQPSPEGPALPLFDEDPTPDFQVPAPAGTQSEVESELAMDPAPEPAELAKLPIDPPAPPRKRASPTRAPPVQPPSTPPPRSPPPAPAPAPTLAAPSPPPPIQREYQQPSSPAGSTSSTSSTSTRTRKSRRSLSNNFVQERDWNYSSKPGPELRIPEFESKLSLIDDRVADEAGSPAKPAATKGGACGGGSEADRDRGRSRARIRREYEPQREGEEEEETQGQDEYGDEYDESEADEQRDLFVAPPNSPAKPPGRPPLAIQPRTSSSTSPSHSPLHQQLPPLPASAPSPTQSPPFVPKSILKKRVSFSADSPKGHEKVPPMDLTMPPPPLQQSQQQHRTGPTLLTDRIPEEDSGGKYYPPSQQHSYPAPASPTGGGQYFSAPPTLAPPGGAYYLPPPSSSPTGYWPPAQPVSYMPAPPYWPPSSQQPLASALGFAPSNRPSHTYHAGNAPAAPTMVLVPASSLYPPAPPGTAYATLPPIVPMSAPPTYARQSEYMGEFDDDDDYDDQGQDVYDQPPPPRQVPVHLSSPTRVSAPPPPIISMPSASAAGSYDPLAKSSYMWHHAHRLQLQAAHADQPAAAAYAQGGGGQQQRKPSAVGAGAGKSRSPSRSGGSGNGNERGGYGR